MILLLELFFRQISFYTFVDLDSAFSLFSRIKLIYLNHNIVLENNNLYCIITLADLSKELFKMAQIDSAFLNACIGFIVAGITDQTTAAKNLNISRPTLIYRLKQLGTDWKTLKEKYVKKTVDIVNNSKIDPDAIKALDEKLGICDCSEQSLVDTINRSQSVDRTNNSASESSGNAMGGSLRAKNGSSDILIENTQGVSLGKSQVNPPPVRDDGLGSLDELINMAPSHLKEGIRMIVNDFRGAVEAKERTMLFDRILKQAIVLKQLSGGEVREKWRDMEYHRPSDLAAKQIEVMELIEDSMVVFLEGARRTRKSSTVFRWDFEHALQKAYDGVERTKTIYIAATGETCKSIYRDLTSAGHSADMRAFHKITPTTRRLVYNFGHEFMITNTTTSGVKGQDADVIIIDEADQVYLNKPKVIADLVATALTNDLKLIFMANRPEGKDLGAFRAFTQIFHDESFWVLNQGLPRDMAQSLLKKIRFITLEQSDIPQMSGEEFDEKKAIIKGIQSVCVGQEYADSQMGDKEPVQGMSFPPVNLKYGKMQYSDFLKNILGSRTPEMIVMGIDPSGGDHPTGITIWGYFAKSVFEVFSMEIDGPENLDDTYIKQKIMDLILEHRVQYVVCESNSGGKKLVYWLRQMGVDAVNDNIRGDESGYGHTDFITNARRFMLENRFFYYSNTLERQLGRYRPHESKDTKRKGDLADACLLALMLIYNKNREALQNRNRAVDISGYTTTFDEGGGNGNDDFYMV